ncbi:hypothetical protein [Alkalihalobacillus sp. 1P02AB]
MFKGIDWYGFSFVVISLVQEYVHYQQLPRIYYWKLDMKEEDDDEKHRAS